MSDQKFCVVGAGLVGSLLSVILAQKGYHVDIYDRRPDLRSTTLIGGRSINLALSDRGFKALQAIGYDEEVKQLCIPMHGRMVHNEDGSSHFMQYGKTGQYINSVSRGGLNQMLLKKADESPNVQMFFDERCEHADVAKGDIYFKNIETGKETKRHYDVIFGTDGAFSAMRLALMKTDMFDFQYSQDYLDHGYKELSIPAGPNGEWQLEKNALHIWPRKSFMMIALPNLDGSFTCTLFLALKGEVSFEHLNTADDLDRFFDKYFSTAKALMPTLVEDFFHNPTSSLGTVKCYPWHYDGKMTLLGDAAHAIVPFYGQGMNCGFEDCTVLNELMEQYGTDWEKIFNIFTTERKPNADAIGDLAKRNFIEMRDLVADPEFILKNAIDKKMAEYFPKEWVPMYSMVTFSETPYAEAKRVGEAHDVVLERVVKQESNIKEKLQAADLKDILSKYI
jgi:kynurenine 3-monooxygenase